MTPPQTAAQINASQIGVSDPVVYDPVPEPWFLIEIHRLNKERDELRECLSDALGVVRIASAYHNHIAYPAAGKALNTVIQRIEALGIEERQ